MPTQLSRYKILEDLGRGCLGTTHLAEPIRDPGRKAVVTLVSEHFVKSPAFVNQLAQMAHITSHLQVEGYIPLREVSLDGNTLVTDRDYVSGNNLRWWFSKALNFEQRMDEGFRYLSRTAEILAKLHRLGFYGHLKPENILVGDQELWITDNWTLPLLPTTEFKRNTRAVSYLPYFAPEVRKDWTALSEKADYYSLGALLHETLLGKPPAAIPLTPSQRSKRYGKEVDNILFRFLNKDPGARQADLNAWLDAMGRLRQILLKSAEEATLFPREDVYENKPEEPASQPMESDTSPVSGSDVSTSPPSPESDDSLLEEMETGTEARYFDSPDPERSLEPQAIVDDPIEDEDDKLAMTPEARIGDSEEIEQVETRVQYFSRDSEAEGENFSKAKAKRESALSGLDDNPEPFRKKAPHVLKAQPKKSAPLWAKLLLAVIGMGLVGGSVFLGIMASTLWK